MKYYIKNLDSNTYYEIRICSVYNDIDSIWSEIKKVKTNEYISLILGESNRYDEFLRKIYEWVGCNNIKLLYRGTRDGMEANYFHNKCNNQGPTICLFKNDKGYIFGGYASTDWTSSNNWKSAPNSFIFTLTNIYGIGPTKFPNSNTNYEIRICSVYNNTNSIWSEIKKVKTNIDSLILKESKRYDEFIKKIYEWSGYNNMKLLYRGTRDGMEGNYFHNKCNNQGPTISLFKNEKGYIFGGCTSIDWTSCNNYKSAPDSFLFTLTNIHGTEPTKFPNSIYTSYSIYDYYSYGPTFGGHDIYTNKSGTYASFPHSYQDILGKGRSIFTGDLNNSNCYFNLKEIEVFKIFK